MFEIDSVTCFRALLGLKENGGAIKQREGEEMEERDREELDKKR